MGELCSKLPFFIIFHLSILFSFGIAEDTIAPGQSINDNQSLISAAGSFELGFFSPGSSKNRYLGVWYHNISVQSVIWVANRQNPIPDSTGSLKITGNGSLILANGAGKVFWSTPATKATSPLAQLLDIGNLVVLDAANNITGSYEWQSFDYPTDTLLPGMKLGWDLRTGLNRNITTWKGFDDPAPGNVTMAMYTDGVPQIFLTAGSLRLWRTGPWVGQGFTGIPEMDTYNMFSFNYVANSDEVTYTFNILRHAIKSQLTVNQSGTVQRLVWLDQSNSWNVFWLAPKDQCDSISPCGPYGVCNTNDSPICNCLQGFQPKSPQDWILRDGSGGCVRKTPLDCRNGTDGFVTVKGAKLPDTAKAAVDMRLSLGDCRTACLSNCSCTGYASADVGGGNGCFMWFGELTDLRVYVTGGQDLYVRMPAADLDSSSEEHPTSRWVTVVISICAVLGTLLMGWSGYYAWGKFYTKRRDSFGIASAASSSRIAYSINDDRAGELELPFYDMGTIRAATNNFSVDKKLGEGGFGPVYKGRLVEGLDIAVKRLSKTSVQGLDEFKNEVLLIAKLQHRNLVRLLGYCIQGDERLLIYEYMPNNSLDAFLFDRRKGAELDWQARCNIIAGIARGLLYLHEDSRLRIIHRDLKASNILLDKEMTPKISDFGMARIFGGDETEANTRKVVGTYGYMSPEYAMDGIFSVKSDVFSFGVLVLEIISGKKNRGVYKTQPYQNLLAHAWCVYKEGNCLELADDSMGSSFPRTEIIRCIKVGLLCVQELPEDRPTMSSVVVMLGSDDASLPHPKQPGFALIRGSSEVLYSSSSNQEINTVNNVTVTMVEDFAALFSQMIKPRSISSSVKILLNRLKNDVN